IFSLSTGALLALVSQLVFIGWEMTTRRIARRWTIFAALAVLGYFTIDLLSNRTPFHVLVSYASFNSASAYNRILIWQFGTENVWANPIFGLGLGDWARPSWMSPSVDNFWLLTAMRYGLPTIISFVLALVLILRRVSLAPLTTPLERACRAGYLVAFGGVVLAGSTVHYWQAIAAFMLFFFGAGVWMINGGAPPEDDDPTPDQVEPPAAGRYARAAPKRASAMPAQPERRRYSRSPPRTGRNRAAK
ncbi:MAG: O-antigen ligase family protein, partial [Paracoccaceae bacterium]